MKGKIVKVFLDKQRGRLQNIANSKEHNFNFASLLFDDRTNLEGKEVEFDIGENGLAVRIMKASEQDGNNSASLQSLDYLLPKDAKKFITTCGTGSINLSLAQNRIFYKDERGKYYPLLFHLAQKEQSRQSIVTSDFILKDIQDKRDFYERDFFEKSIKLKYTPYQALIIGTGTVSPSDNIPLMTIHRIYGVPYIPGSALKGVIRAYQIHKHFCGSEEKAMVNDDFIKVYGRDDADGRSATRGNVVFLDVFPVEYNIYYEIFTPHYTTYYTGKGKQAPDDGDRPNLLYFPAVKGTFDILFGTVRENSGIDLETLCEDTKEAMDWIGLGGKTSSGYGIGSALRL